MTVRKVSPHEASQLIDDESYALVDVRTVPEFEAGHPKGAFNVPLNHAGATGMVPNPDFMRVMEKCFDKHAKLVVACKAGGRSMKAASMLADAGFTNLVDQCAGWSGAADPFGKGMMPGWSQAGLPAAATPHDGHSWAELLARADR